MSENVELSSFNLRYEEYRLRDDVAEARLLVSITERGIQEPLEGVDTPLARHLFNGFNGLLCRAVRLPVRLPRTASRKSKRWSTLRRSSGWNSPGRVATWP